MKHSIRLGLIGFISATAAACASIVGKTDQAIVFNSEPSEASLLITDENGKQVYKGTTPTSVTLAKSDGYFDGQEYTVIFSKNSFEDSVVVITISQTHGILAVTSSLAA